MGVPGSRRPILYNIKLITPYWSLYIHFHIWEDTAVGIAQGISTAALTNPLSLKSAFKTNAVANPSINSISTENIVKYIVFHKADKKTLVFK